MTRKVGPKIAPTEDPSIKHQEFIDALLSDPYMNATKAYMRVFPGSSEAAARRSASRLLTRDDVARALETEMRARAERTKVDKDWVMRNLVEVAQRCMQHVPVMEWNPELKAHVQAVDGEGRGIWAFDAKGANTALGMIGKHVDVQAFSEKQEVNHTGARPVLVKVVRKTVGE